MDVSVEIRVSFNSTIILNLNGGIRYPDILYKRII
jgi:hypothetical protein